MRNISPELKAHYAQSTTTLSVCWRATLTDETVVYSTNADRDLTIDGNLYSSAAGISATDVDTPLSLEVGNLDIDGFLRSPQITVDDMHSGRWDNAKILIFEVNRLDLTMGKRIIRAGTLGEIKAGKTMFTAEMRGLSQALSMTIGQLVTKECTADLGDARCKVDLAPYTVTGTIDAVADNQIITDAARTEADDWFTNGKITFTSGGNNGFEMEVKRYAVGEVELQLPMYFQIVAGDTYSMIAGCRKRYIEDCKDKFDNLNNFRGFPLLPLNEIYRVGQQPNN